MDDEREAVGGAFWRGVMNAIPPSLLLWWGILTGLKRLIKLLL